MGTEDDFMFRSPTRRTAVVLQNTRILSSMLHSAATSTPSSEAQPAVSAGPGVAAAVPCVPTGAAGRLPDRGTLWISATCCCCCSSSGCESSSTVSWMKPEISLSCFRLLASTHGSRWVLKTSSRRPGHCAKGSTEWPPPLLRTLAADCEMVFPLEERAGGAGASGMDMEQATCPLPPQQCSVHNVRQPV
eukprot:CAMPEP_0117673704 /NCGR_PEP_ID=MMETSP0804-20121206/14618_1 /TAXON_ID=1074897 /ORGANISM="Tetraselmis astigmatica, Strain CCMP880" /LENGTH=189 /DNA_ID=CAMNT_0005482467 /DNA_START=301 /DNA_END=871 /DNA_ORIENTATION=-